jgi:hypothetical protein
VDKFAIPTPVASFILEHIHSVEQLEVLLLLRNKGGEWTAPQIAAELRISALSTQARLDDLKNRDFLVVGLTPGSFRYEPVNSKLSREIDAVADCYAHFRVSVINLIFSVPGDSARSLAEAFRLKRKQDE